MTHTLPPNIHSHHIHGEIMTQMALFPTEANLLGSTYNIIIIFSTDIHHARASRAGIYVIGAGVHMFVDKKKFES